jgi:hypothetical protein
MATKDKLVKREPQQTAVITMDDNLKQQIAKQQQALSKIVTSTKFISFKGGQIIIDNKVVPGGKTDVVLLAFMGERSFFPDGYDPDVRQSPLCYAYFNTEDDADETKPHPKAKEAQAKTCAECAHNEWGSANVGRGKACRESVRIALLPAVQDMSKAQIWHARVPITSVGAFKSHISDILSAERPVWAVVSELTVTPDAKTFFKISWAVKRGITQNEVAVLSAKAISAERDIAFEYPDFEETAAPAKPVKKLKQGKSK